MPSHYAYQTRLTPKQPAVVGQDREIEQGTRNVWAQRLPPALQQQSCAKCSVVSCSVIWKIFATCNTSASQRPQQLLGLALAPCFLGYCLVVASLLWSEHSETCSQHAAAFRMSAWAYSLISAAVGSFNGCNALFLPPLCAFRRVPPCVPPKYSHLPPVCMARNRCDSSLECVRISQMARRFAPRER